MRFLKSEKHRLRLTESDLRNIVKESVNAVLNEDIFYDDSVDEDELCHYSYFGKCTQMDAEEVQEITHWDEDAETNEYAIQDEYWENGYFEIIPIEEFLKATDGEYRIKPKNIAYCALNKGMDILFCLSKKGIHYFYE